MKVKFAKTFDGDEIDVRMGAQQRLFRRSEQPFEVAPQEAEALHSFHHSYEVKEGEATVTRREPTFVIVAEKVKELPPVENK